jgi:hypothetical protein
MGSIEFRNHSGTVDADKVENYIRLTYGFILATERNVPVFAPKTEIPAKDGLNALLSYFQKIKVTSPQVTSFYQARARKFEAQV